MATVETIMTTMAPTEDPFDAIAAKNVKAAFLELQAKGIVDEQGRRIRQDLPADMQPNSDRDFGG